MRPDEYAARDAVSLAELVRVGEVTPGELQECAVFAHEQLRMSVNAIVDVHPLDADRLSTTGPLAGVPTLIKDLFHGQVGTVCGNGSRLSEGWEVTSTTQLYERTVASGMTPIGRSTTSEFGIMGTTETLAQSTTRSPWSADHMAGGSSGGAGAAVGSGIVPIALASDGGGSIRIPASSCGVVGLKPSRGRVPWGLRQKEPLIGWAVQFAVTRTVRDTAVALDALCGPTPGDVEGLLRPDTPFAEAMKTPTDPLRIAWWAYPWSGHDPDPVIVEATQATALLLEQMGHHVEAATPRFDWETYLQAMTDVWACTSAFTIDAFAEAIGRPVDVDTVEGATLRMVEEGRAVTAKDLLAAIDVETALTVIMNDFFSRYDVLLTPTLAATLAPIGDYDPHALTPAKETFATWSKWETFLPVFNTTGQPAISLPLQMTPDGLPIGMQFVGGLGQEALLLSLAASLEEALPWRDRRPPAYVT
ncbi:MAG: amidase [Actinobacteria bacterium]|nr:amidase [Actinomycetota bacterium]